jgi:hypothetical protein
MDYYSVNPEYQNFVAGESYIKFETYYDAFFRDRLEVLKFALPIAFFVVVFALAAFTLQAEASSISEAAIGKIENCEPRGESFILTYSYSVPTGRGYSTNYRGRKTYGNSSRLRCDKLIIGMPLEIKYNPQDPFQSNITDQVIRPKTALIGDMIFGVAAIVAGFIAILITGSILNDIRQLVRYYRIYRRFHKVSTPIIGKVTGYLEGKIGYEFISPDGKKLSGQQSFSIERTPHIKLLPSGSPVLVLYEADDCFLIL